MQLTIKRVTDELWIHNLNAKDDENDLMAIIPLTNDDKYNKEVLVPFAETICGLPSLLKQIEAAEQALVAIGELKFAEKHVDEAISNLRAMLKKS